ncbi:transposon Ty3-G Gag-Pol polyprotein [Trichonephila clavipes]|nr:transposon Ty3-G Gag-Pol polyprotein [Trichonephila clavipes]
MYDYEIKYLKGSTNIEADMLSRHPVAHHLQHSSHLPDINEIKTHQKNDNLCGPKYNEIKDVIVIKKKNLHKIVIPFSLRLKLLNQAHEQFGHSDVQKMLNLISLQYYWSNITTDISEFVKHCMVPHHPETNGKNERVNQSLVTRLKCKVNASSTKIPWTKLLDQVCKEYNSTPHSITKYPPAYLLFGLLPYQSPIDQNNYYEPVDGARCELALQREQ